MVWLILALLLVHFFHSDHVVLNQTLVLQCVHLLCEKIEDANMIIKNEANPTAAAMFMSSTTRLLLEAF